MIDELFELFDRLQFINFVAVVDLFEIEFDVFTIAQETYLCKVE